jgi:hypothetical protein
MARSGNPLSDEIVAGRPRGRGRARRLAKLAQDVRDVPVNRVLADHQLRGDLAVAPPGRHQGENLTLTATERACCVGSPPSPLDEAIGGRHVATGVELDESVSRRGRLPLRWLLRTELKQNPCQRKAGASSLVRRLAPPEEIDCILEPTTRELEITAGKSALAARFSGRCSGRRGADLVCEPVCLQRRLPRGVHAAGRDGRTHEQRQDGDPVQVPIRLGGTLESLGQRECRRRVALVQRQLHTSQARDPRPLGLGEERACLVQTALTAAELPKPREIGRAHV